MKDLGISAMVIAASMGALFATEAAAQVRSEGRVQEFFIDYKHQGSGAAGHKSSGGFGHNYGSGGSTHEVTFANSNSKELWLTGQNYDRVVKANLDGSITLIPLPPKSGPHGIQFDADLRLWVTLEFASKVVELSPEGKILKEYDVSLDCTTCLKRIGTNPHGLGIGPDGKTLWYTGKSTGTVGKISPDGKIQTFQLPTVGSVPIYIKAGPDGNMWLTELVGNAIARVTPDGVITEFPIPSSNSRPIAIIPEPSGRAMWFSQEATNKIARIDMDGKITEFPIAKMQDNVLLGGLAFDSEKNIWVQQYVDHGHGSPTGRDHIIKIDKAILTAKPEDASAVATTFYPVQSTNTHMHRIIEGPDGNMWFTELGTDRLGRVLTK
jgi:virginiamycin B lyase